MNFPVRAFNGVGGTPVFMERGEGAYLIDADGNRYIDYVGSWGPMIAGHSHPAVLGAIRYVQHFLAAPETPGQPPSEDLYQREAGAIGDAQFWLIGRTNTTDTITEPHFGLVDEASKLNLNTATLEMLEALPRMTPDLAAAIIDWRDADSKVTPGGAEDETYLRKNPPYRCKNAPFESVDELRLVEIVRRAIVSNLLSPRTVRVQPLLLAVPVLRDDGTGGVENHLS